MGEKDPWVARMMTRSIGALAEHLTEHYGRPVRSLTALDVGVFRVDFADGPGWLARVFPSCRPVSEVEGDAAILRALEAAGFPAERCAHPEPVSVLDGQGVLVTGFVDGVRADGRGRTFGVLGGLLGALHARSGRSQRPGGGWHHLVVGGGPSDEVAAAESVLDELPPPTRAADREGLAVLRDALDDADDAADLPESFVHPDFVPANAITTPAGDLVIVDWTGAGRGPRLWSLAWLLWAAGLRGPRLVEIAASRYRRHTTPQPAELDRLAAVMRTRLLTIDCWAVAAGRKTAAAAAADLPRVRRRADAAARTAREAFHQT